MMCFYQSLLEKIIHVKFGTMSNAATNTPQKCHYSFRIKKSYSVTQQQKKISGIGKLHASQTIK